ncbi:hypothetical protein CSIM01_04747 [Colletotrichum simmondsii]|uniref:Uncharacterized protein n=1 Tax=Colletotrichum simmondsii TaxID=703756 RepID=A0A135TU51_9PEZI|nr:hypothetical protein CSIM01_04747 [Colletotrichum simmondsii]
MTFMTFDERFTMVGKGGAKPSLPLVRKMTQLNIPTSSSGDVLNSKEEKKKQTSPSLTETFCIASVTVAALAVEPQSQSPPLLWSLRRRLSLIPRLVVRVSIRNDPDRPGPVQRAGRRFSIPRVPAPQST